MIPIVAAPTRLAGTTAIDGTTTPSTITTTGRTTNASGHAYGIYADHLYTNPDEDTDPEPKYGISITLDDTEITTAVAKANHPAGYSIFTHNNAKGNTEVTLNSGVKINTEGPAILVKQAHHVTNTKADAILNANSMTITTKKDFSSKGLLVLRDFGVGDAQVTVSDSTITTEGSSGIGIHAERSGPKEGDITFTVTNGSITTGCTATATGCTKSSGYNAYGTLGHQAVRHLRCDRLMKGSFVSTYGMSTTQTGNRQLFEDCLIEKM